MTREMRILWALGVGGWALGGGLPADAQATARSGASGVSHGTSQRAVTPVRAFDPEYDAATVAPNGRGVTPALPAGKTARRELTVVNGSGAPATWIVRVRPSLQIESDARALPE